MTFARCGETCGNNSNDIHFAVTVRNDQQASFAIKAEGDPALFIMVVVLNRERAFVVEDRFRFGEAQPFVLEFVGCVLAFVVLNVE